MIDSFRVDSSFLNWTKVSIIMWAVFFPLFSIKHKKDTWCQPPVWQHSSQMSPSTWQSDSTSHQMMSCQWRRRGKEQRPPAPDRTEREKKDILRQPQIYIFICFIIKTLILHWLGTGDQIFVRRSHHSPTAAGGRKAPSHFLSASQANTPL